MKRNGAASPETRTIMTANQTNRDRRVKPMYDFTSQLAMLEPPPPLMQRLFLALRSDHDGTNQFLSAITGSRPLPEFMSPEYLDRIMASAGIRD